MTATIFNIQRLSFVDGPGIRTTVFLKGCNLKCAWCHNPESQAFAPQLLFYKEKCTNCGKCKEVCPNNLQKCDLCGKCEMVCPAKARRVCGKQYTVEQLAQEIAKDKVFFESSNGGVTFSGGECMLQVDFLAKILKCTKKLGIHTAVDTAGCVKWENFERIIPYTDLFLYDVKCIDGNMHKKFIGADNALILENLSKLLKKGCNVIVRIPLIVGVNDTLEEMQKIKDFLAKHGYQTGVEILPYHALGENKWRAIGVEPKKFKAPSNEKIEQFQNVFKK
ncbi:MAG: glycyl-radical enzyme activating protein [Clostridia bacterium]|nr:glycyl-radical enzyme activating protein [Clostridia bacterium]